MKKARPAPLTKPCASCPWRTENQGKRSPGGFYTAANLRRLWNGIRRGGAMSCHLTDPSHPDHIAAGCKPDAEVRECAGSVVIVIRELKAAAPDLHLTPESFRAYLQRRKKGLTRDGFAFWAVQRILFAGKPIVGGEPLPPVDENEPAIALPPALAEG